MTRLASYSLLALVALPASLAQLDSMPCMDYCLNIATHPCTANSLASLINCVDNLCNPPPTLSIIPKYKASCKPSDFDNPGPVLQLSGNATCVSNMYDFKSFIPSSGSQMRIEFLSKECSVSIFDEAHCAGTPSKVKIQDMRDNACYPHGGRSVSMTCSGSPLDRRAAYRKLADMCLNSTSTTGTQTASPPYAAGNATASAHRTASALGTPISYSTSTVTTHSTSTVTVHPTATGRPTSPYAVTMTPLPDLAGTDSVAKPSLAALVALIAVALAML